MSMMPTLPVVVETAADKKRFPKGKYADGMTKQSFKDQTDINKIMAKAQKTGTISHLAKYEPMYGDFSDVDDLLTAHSRLERAEEIFSELPSEVRREFGQSWSKFFRFVNDPANRDRLKELLPEIAKAGGYLPVVNEGMGGSPAAEEAAAAAASTSTPEASSPPPASGGEASPSPAPAPASTSPGT